MRKFEIPTDLQIFDSYVLPADFLNTVVNAEEVIRVAYEHSKKIIQQAEVEKQNIIAKSRNEAEEKLQDIRNQMWKDFEGAKANIISEMYGKMEVFLNEFRASMPHLIETILFRIIGEFDPDELTARCIAMGIEEMRDATEMVIRVNPENEERLKELLSPWLRDHKAGGGFIRMETDHFIAAGQAALITEIGSIELSVADQILAFTDNLKNQFTPVNSQAAKQGGENE